MNYCLLFGSFLSLSTLTLLALCYREMRSLKPHKLPDQAPEIDATDDSPDDRYWQEAVQPIAPASAVERIWLEAGYNHAISDLAAMLERVTGDPAEDAKVQATLGAIAAELRGKSDAS
ncbi:MAG: hypothetical protein H7Z11_20320 [Verrucomicrobia bacterium]|nr:hypothetical protein [Leptolyngbya sp. ES-bin-22]